MSVRFVVAAAVGIVAGIYGGPAVGLQAFSITYGVTGFLDPKQKALGPRLNDLKAPQASYGTPIPYLEGIWRTAGVYIWASEKHEIATTQSQGKGGPGVESTTFTYEIDVLIELAIHECVGILKIYSNGKLVWTSEATADIDTLKASATTNSWRDIRFYSGAADQLPDPVYEAAVGIGNAPAYRGRATVFIEGLNLGSSGQLPVLTFEVVREGTLDVLPQDGLLCHFDELAGDGKVVSVLGPNMSHAAGTSLGSTLPPPKFGANRGEPRQFLAEGVTGTLDQSWRAEGWFYTLEDGQYFQLGNEGSLPAVNLGRYTFFGDSAWISNINCNMTDAGGRWGAYEDRTLGEWTHLGIQYDATRQELRAFSNGKVLGLILSIGPGDYFGSTTFSQISVGSASCYCDEFFYRAIEDDEVYLENYSVPTAPFEPPPKITTLTPILPGLDDVVSRLCLRTGQLTEDDIDVTALAGKIVRGMAISQVSTTRVTLEMLMGARLIDCVENQKIVFVPRGGAPAMTIAYEDLGASPDGNAEPVPMKRLDDIEVAAAVTVKFANVLNNYQDGAESADRLVTDSTAVAVIELPLAFTPVEAKRLAEANTMDLAVKLLEIGPISLPRKYAALEPTDIIIIQLPNGSTLRSRILQGTIGGGINTFGLALDDATVINSEAETDTDYASSTLVKVLQDTLLELLDIPILRDVDDAPGFYAAAKPRRAGAWPGYELDKSLDDVTYAKVLDTNARAVFGTAGAALGDFAGGNVFDEINVLTVDVGEGELSSVSRDALLTLPANALLVGAEIIQFRSASLLSPGSYLLSGMLRGRRGTEWAIPGHEDNERVVLLTADGLRRVQDQQADIGIPRYWKAVTFGKSRASAASQRATDTGVALKPFSPVDLRVAKASQDLVLSWKRRTRLSTRFVGAGGINVPLGEASEAYSIDVVKDGLVVRTATSTAQSLAYTAQMQKADGVFLSDLLTFKVYQVSALVGRGYAGSMTAYGVYQGQAQISTITLTGTFQTDAVLQTAINTTSVSYTVAAGDTDLVGAAASFAATIDAALPAAFTVSVLSNVITITRAMAFTLSASLGGSINAGFDLKQKAAPAGPGVPEIIKLGLYLIGGATSNTFQAGTNYSLRFDRGYPNFGDRVVTYSFSNAPAGLTNYQIIENLISATPVTSDSQPAGIVFNYINGFGDFPSAVFPADGSYWSLTGYSSQNDVYFPAGIAQLPLAPVAADQPQVVAAFFVGGPATPVVGSTFRLTLDGTNFDYIVLTGDTYQDVLDGLVALISADPDFTADDNYFTTVAGAQPQMTISATAANVPFTYSGALIPSTIVLTATTTQDAI